VLDTLDLDQKIYTIGRDSKSNIHLDDPSVSRLHASLSMVGTQFFVEDHKSTNGTFLNKKRVTMHVLKDGDEIALGHFNLRFEDDAANSSDMEKTQVLGGVASARQDESFRKVDDVPEYAILTFIKGPHAGEVKRIEGSLYTIGRPGGDVAVVARRPQGFFLLHIGGNSNPMINGTEVTSTRGIQLNEGDIIQVGEIEAELQFE
jgi:pSer/pThr/pTyr-binding forkhead associated (FHA) protein